MPNLRGRRNIWWVAQFFGLVPPVSTLILRMITRSYEGVGGASGEGGAKSLPFKVLASVSFFLTHYVSITLYSNYCHLCHLLRVSLWN